MQQTLRTSLETLSPGDRLPNLLLKDPAGAGEVLHRLHLGRPMAVLVMRSEPPEAVVAALQVAEDLNPLLLCPQSQLGQLRARWPTAPLFAIEDAALDFLAGPSDSWCLLLADPDLRLRARCVDGELALRMLAVPAQFLSPPTAALVLAVAAPVLMIPSVLEPDLCRRAIDHLAGEHGGGETSGVLRYQDGRPVLQVEPRIKMRREAIVAATDLETVLHERVTRRVLPEIARAFHFRVARREHFKLLSYAAGAGYFRVHRDNDAPDVAHRRFAMTLNLNTGDYAGGALRFPEFGPHEYVAPAGAALVFSCSLLHEVTDITHGHRYALTTFFH